MSVGLDPRRVEVTIPCVLRRLFGSQDTPPSEFGPFTAFAKDGAYLSLLSLVSDDVPSVLTHLADTLRSTSDAPIYVARMRDDPNWRGHLLAATAVLLSDDRAHYAPMLWRAFDHPSWVAPQLGVTLYLSDPDFSREAKARLLHCPQAVISGNRSKDASSLLRVLAYDAADAGWVASQLQRPEARHLLSRDIDRSDDIADSWRQAVQRQFTQVGRVGRKGN